MVEERPGNVFVDSAVRYITKGELESDKVHEMGEKAKVGQAIVDEMLQQPYFVHDVPKTTGRETFGGRMGEEICKSMLKKAASPEDCVSRHIHYLSTTGGTAPNNWAIFVWAAVGATTRTLLST